MILRRVYFKLSIKVEPESAARGRDLSEPDPRTPPTGFVFPPSHTVDTWRRGRGRVHMALTDLSGHARPSHSACTSTQVMRPSVAHGAGLVAVLLPAGPGGGPHIFCMGGTAILVGFRSLPYKLYGVFHPMFKYCKTFALFQKLPVTGGGDSTLITNTVLYCNLNQLSTQVFLPGFQMCFISQP